MNPIPKQKTRYDVGEATIARGCGASTRGAGGWLRRRQKPLLPLPLPLPLLPLPVLPAPLGSATTTG